MELVKMAKDSTYVVGPKNLLEGLLNNPGFNNRGGVRYSVDGSQILLEEDGSKFVEALTHKPDVQEFTEEEIVAYLQENVSDWETPVEE